MLVVNCNVFQLSGPTFKVDKLIAFSKHFCNHGDIEAFKLSWVKQIWLIDQSPDSFCYSMKR